jgi:membrane-associated phospholipid phosphatase
MNVAPDKYPRFPGWRHLGTAAVLSFAVLVLFCLVYGATDYLSHGRTLVKVHFEAELSIPFVPAMTLAYVSMYGIFVLAPFLLRAQRELLALAAALAAAILVAGACFIVWPAEPAFPRPNDLGIWAPLYRAADWINLRYNMTPSLHVGLSIATVSILTRRCRRSFAVLLWIWGALVCVSTLFTHQHHLLDVATGIALGVAVDRMVFATIASNTSGHPGAGSNTVGLTPPNFCPREAQRSTKVLHAAPSDGASCRTSSGAN